MGHPDFRVNGRIFATLHADDQWGMVKLTPDEQRAFIEAAPAAFKPESGAWGRQGVRPSGSTPSMKRRSGRRSRSHGAARPSVRGAEYAVRPRHGRSESRDHLSRCLRSCRPWP